MNRKIKKFWNYKIDENKKVSLRKKGLKWLAAFMIIMIFCTVISRAAGAMTIPHVNVARPEKQSIDHTVSAQGRVIQNREEAVNVLGGIRVKNVFVCEGENVLAGDVLFELDMEDLNEKLIQSRNELQKQDYQLLDSRSAQAASNNDKNLARQRAAEDYNNAVSQTDQAVNHAYQEMVDAENALNNFLNQPETGESGEDSIETGLVKGYEAALENYENLRKDYEAAGGTGDEEALKNAESERDAALKALEDYRNQKALENTENRQETIDGLQAAYDEKKRAYEAALQDKDNQILAASRAVEDANKPSSSDSSEDTMLLDRELKEREIEKLEELWNKDGKITSPVDGLVNKVNVITGEATTEGTSVLLADTTEGGRFKAQIPSNQEKYVSRGDKVELQGSNNETIKDLTIDTVTEDSQNLDMLNITVQVPKDTLEIGTVAKMRLLKASETYQNCVPLSAVRQDGNQAFILIAVQQDTILGKEYVAQRLDVTVSDKNGETAALAPGSISSDQMVITGSDKNVEPGDKIRLADQ